MILEQGSRTVPASESVLCFGGSLVSIESYRNLVLHALKQGGHIFRHVEVVDDAATAGAGTLGKMGDEAAAKEAAEKEAARKAQEAVEKKERKRKHKEEKAAAKSAGGDEGQEKNKKRKKTS